MALVSKSKAPPVPVPNQDLYSFILERPDRPFPDDHVIYIDGNTNRKLTYAEIREQAKEFGIGLKSIWGWRKGDVLAIFSTNQLDTPPLTWGTIWASGVVTPVNPTYTADELAFQLRDSGAKALATIADLLPVAAKAAALAGIPEDRIILIGDKRMPQFRHWKEIADHSRVFKWRRTKINPETDVAFLVYSSGTTGLPKGVMLSHRNIATNVLQLLEGEKNNLSWERDRIMAFLPFFHIYGLSCLIHHSCYSGRALVVMDRFDLAKFCSLIQQHKITYAYVVPPVILLLAKSPVVDKYDLSSLRMLNSGAAPLTRELVEAASSRLRVPVKQGYGLSETAPVTHSQPWEEWRKTVGSVGKLLPNQEMKFLGPNGEDIPIGQTGEICIRGPNIMLGYHNNPTATANSISPDGWFRTGDIGHEDENGNLYVTDRVKELIKYKGFQVPPAELEGKLASHEKVADVGVVGVYDEGIASEVPRAYIVPKPGVSTDGLEKELVEWIHERVAQHKRLRGGVRLVEAIPKSASGKILRRVLREQAKQEAQAQQAKAKL